jgi:hypothetical protein
MVNEERARPLAPRSPPTRAAGRSEVGAFQNTARASSPVPLTQDPAVSFLRAETRMTSARFVHTDRIGVTITTFASILGVNPNTVCLFPFAATMTLLRGNVVVHDD